MFERFSKPLRTGTVGGERVAAKAVPFSLVKSIMAAEKENDDEARVLCMAQTVRECVTYEDGGAIDVDTLDMETIAELFKFANGKAQPASDFTPPASPAGGATERT